MTVGFLGLGGNLGDPQATMGDALRRLDAHPSIAIEAVSRPFRTPPWGKTDQPFFLNACARIATTLDADGLLDVCLRVERALKRERAERWGPRTVDLDILVLGDTRLSTPRLTIPHPRMGERAFVLVPLADLDEALSVGGRTVADRLRGLDRTGIDPLSETRDWWRGPDTGIQEMERPSCVRTDARRPSSRAKSGGPADRCA